MLPGNESPEGSDQDASLHMCLVQSIRGDPPRSHRPAENRRSWQHVHPRIDRRILSVGRTFPHQDYDGIGIGYLHISTYGTIRQT